MSFEQDGFLSQKLAGQIRAVRRDHAPWFSLARTLNRLGQRIVLKQREIESGSGLADHRVVGMLFYTRAVSSFQGAVLMAERGMIVEASTIIRSLIETTWILAGLAKEKDSFVSDLAAADYAERKAHGNWYLATPSATKHISARNMAKMKKFIAKLEKSETPLRKLVLANVASATGLTDLYAIYRHLSHHFAHPSVTAVSIFTIEGPGKNEKSIFWNSEYGLDQMADTLAYACAVMIGASLAVNEVMPTKNVSWELTKAFKAYRKLVTATIQKNKRKKKAGRDL